MGAGMAGAVAMVLSSTIANVAVPTVMGAFGVGQDQAQWLATAFVATMVASQLLSAWFVARLRRAWHIRADQLRVLRRHRARCRRRELRDGRAGTRAARLRRRRHAADDHGAHLHPVPAGASRPGHGDPRHGHSDRPHARADDRRPGDRHPRLAGNLSRADPDLRGRVAPRHGLPAGARGAGPPRAQIRLDRLLAAGRDAREPALRRRERAAFWLELRCDRDIGGDRPYRRRRLRLAATAIGVAAARLLAVQDPAVHLGGHRCIRVRLRQLCVQLPRPGHRPAGAGPHALPVRPDAGSGRRSRHSGHAAIRPRCRHLSCPPDGDARPLPLRAGQLPHEPDRCEHDLPLVRLARSSSHAAEWP